jgi:hypothetical protein
MDAAQYNLCSRDIHETSGVLGSTAPSESFPSVVVIGWKLIDLEQKERGLKFP